MSVPDLQRILLATNEGPLHIQLYPDARTPGPASHLLRLCAEDIFDGAALECVIQKFFMEFVPIKSAPTLDFQHASSTVSFDRAGMVALGPKNQLIISLDRCDAIEKKYMVIGEIEEPDMNVLHNIALYESDQNHVPLVPLHIIAAKVLHHKPPSSPDLNAKKRKSPFKAPAGVSFLQRQQTVAIKRAKLAEDALSKEASRINDEQQVIKTSGLHAAIATTETVGIARSFSVPELRAINIIPKFPTRLVIIRHGESEQNAALDLQQDIEDIDKIASIRDADIKLTPKGILQARHTGLHLAHSDKFDICFASPYDRCKKTADEIVRQLPYPLKVYSDNLLREKEFGRAHGLQANHIRERFPGEFVTRERDGKYWYRFPGGENYPDVEMRIMAFLERLTREYAGRSVLVVTHQVPFKMFRAVVQHLDETKVLSLENVNNCGIQEYLLDRRKNSEGRMKLKTFNYVAYDEDVLEKEHDSMVRQQQLLQAHPTVVHGSPSK